MKWLDDNGSVTKEELLDNRKVADVVCCSAYAAANATNTEYWIGEYFELTGENKKDYIDRLNKDKPVDSNLSVLDLNAGDEIIYEGGRVTVVGFSAIGYIVYEDKDGGIGVLNGESTYMLAPKKLSGFVNIYGEGSNLITNHECRTDADKHVKDHAVLVRTACIDLSQLEEGHGL
ncbi:MAG: hypothetical protein V3R25_05950 [Nitrosomonadaceae bacterium]